MRRILFHLAADLPLTFVFSLMGCAAHQTVAAMPDFSHPIVFRTDMPPEALAAIPTDAAKAILIARSYWEISPHIRGGTGPFTFKVWRTGRGWEALVYSHDTKGLQIQIDADWQIGVVVSD